MSIALLGELVCVFWLLIRGWKLKEPAVPSSSLPPSHPAAQVYHTLQRLTDGLYGDGVPPAH